MKRMLLSIVVLLVLLCGVAVAEEVTIIASGNCGKYGDNVTWELNSMGMLTISGEGEMRDYNMVSDVPWYSNRVSIQTAVIEEGVTKIGNYSFYSCSGLSSIEISAGVTSIGNGAFYDCSNLSTIEIPIGVTSIGYGTFCGCSGLSCIELPTGVTRIESNAFKNCRNLCTIRVPSSVTNIGSWAFSGCSSLKKVYTSSIEGWLNISFASSSSAPTYYGAELYIADELVTDLVLPKGITQINNFTFYGCSSLNRIELPAGVTSIGNSAFYGCSSLSRIELPVGVTNIGDWAFYSCSSLHSITIPKGVPSIGEYTFSGCSSLSIITIPEGVTCIGDSAFSWCKNLCCIDIPESVTFIGDSAFRNCVGSGIILLRGTNMPLLGTTVFSYSPSIYCYEFSGVDFWAADRGYTRVYIDNMDLSRPLSIELPEDIRLALGESFTVTPATFPQNANQGIVWESSNPSVVSVEDGVLTAHTIGQATITASCDEISDQMSVTVYAYAESFELSETELWIVSKQSAQLDICNIEPAGATAYFTWESSDTAVLKVSGGSISALKPGDATVTVTSDNGVVRSCLVHVCYPVTAIALEQSKYQLTVGEDAQITANVTTRNQSYVNRLVKFESSDEKVATVDQTGRIHAVSAGTATITVAATSGVSATCTVTVEPCTHTPATDPAVPATHVTTGLTEGSHCSVCGEVLAAQQIVPIVQVEKVVLPAELEIIEAEAFAGDSFECAVLPEGCKAIGANAFKSCTQLRFIEIPDSVTSIDGSAFEGCSNLIIVTTSGSVAEDFANRNNITCVTLD